MKQLLLLLTISLAMVSCKKDKSNSNIAYQTNNAAVSQGEAPYTEQPLWSNDASIYEVNIRQFSEEGTLDAVTQQLQRIKNMGIEIVWLMPLHPISEAKRKEKPGDLGSYYAVGDFRAINPEYGTMDDFDNLLQKAHELDLKLLLDWVPNHTGWDHPWITEHPDYYTQNEQGEIVDPINPDTGESWGWTDVADLNYDNPEMRAAMISDMKFWVDKGVDGFRCDVAHGVPVDFWKECVSQLKDASKDKELFWLAEAESPELAGIFNMSYAWSFHHILQEVLHKELPKTALKENIDNFHKNFGANHYGMMFTSNHDENSWAGTTSERYGKAQDAMNVLTFTIDGMPLVYSGQEAGLNKRLKFFSKDPIVWGNYAKQNFFTQLLDLKKNNTALWNGEFGGDLEVIDVTENENIYLYKRQKDKNQVLVAINFSDLPQKFDWNFEHDGSWKLELGEVLPDDSQIKLESNGYAVWVRNTN